MFIVAAITTHRERARGTLERLMAMPVGRLDLLAGYGIAFAVMACIQVTLTRCSGLPPQVRGRGR
jgi:ABC-2 type transport system permease protein